jgi:hypothetical protein
MKPLGRLAPACPRVSRALGSDWMVPRIFFHAYQFQAEVAKSVQDAVKVGLIIDLADDGALFVARFDGNPSNADARRPVRRPRTAILYLVGST